MNPLAPIIFLLVVISVILCVVKDIRFKFGSKTITIDYAIPPLVGVLALMVFQVLSFSDVFQGGLIGDSRIQPYAIMIIFNALAYLCISIDLTGLLAFIALKVAGRAGSSSFRLFTYFFLLAAVFTVFTSNDIVILTLTPIIYYCSQATGLDPMPFLFAEFLAANICSLVLLIGNPTNIIVGEANKLTFVSYSMWMILPTFGATAVAFTGLYLNFKAEFSRTFVPPTLDASMSFKDKRAAIFHSVVLISTLLLLSLAPVFGGSLWQICGASALIVFLYNAFSWPWDTTAPVAPKYVSPLSPTKTQTSYQSLDSEHGESHSPEHSKVSSDERTLVTPQKSGKAENGGSFSSIESPSSRLLDGAITKTYSDLEAGAAAVNDDVPAEKNAFGSPQMPSVKKSLAALPFRIIPFVFGMFVLVEGLYKSGWIDYIATAIVNGIPSGDGTWPIFVSSFLMSLVTIVLCNFINNQPATILLTRVIISDKFMSLPGPVRSVGMFGVILGSNLGANFTLIGALAGIMFAKILAEKNLTLSYLDFAKVGFKIMPFVTLVAAGLLWLVHLAYPSDGAEGVALNP